jgi:hypothetical protein
MATKSVNSYEHVNLRPAKKAGRNVLEFCQKVPSATRAATPSMAHPETSSHRQQKPKHQQDDSDTE